MAIEWRQHNDRVWDGYDGDRVVVQAIHEIPEGGWYGFHQSSPVGWVLHPTREEAMAAAEAAYRERSVSPHGPGLHTSTRRPTPG